MILSQFLEKQAVMLHGKEMVSYTSKIGETSLVESRVLCNSVVVYIVGFLNNSRYKLKISRDIYTCLGYSLSALLFILAVEFLS